MESYKEAATRLLLYWNKTVPTAEEAFRILRAALLELKQNRTVAEVLDAEAFSESNTKAGQNQTSSAEEDNVRGGNAAATTTSHTNMAVDSEGDDSATVPPEETHSAPATNRSHSEGSMAVVAHDARPMVSVGIQATPTEGIVVHMICH